MKKLIYTGIILLLLGSTGLLKAQTKILPNDPKPVLLVDNKPTTTNMAFESLVNGYGTICTSISDLSSKQETRILKLESRRDKKLSKIDARIKKTNAQLKSQKTNLSEKQIKKAEKKVLNLLLDRQAVTGKAKKLILKELTPAQKEKAGWR